MIWMMPKESFPTENQAEEILEYKDSNEFIWKIGRVANGFFLKYCGDEYFSLSVFEIELEEDEEKRLQLTNTGCYFFQDADFEVFYAVRELIKHQCTDSICYDLADFFTVRFQASLGVLEHEEIRVLQ